MAKKNSRFMHQRTCGSISGLSQLVRSAAIRAIYTGTEATTRTTARIRADRPRHRKRRADLLAPTASLVTSLATAPLQPLPLRVKHFPRETLRCYLARLEAAHRLHAGLLSKAILKTELRPAEYLSRLIGIAEPILERMFVEVRPLGFMDFYGLIRPTNREYGYACATCATVKGIRGPIHIWAFQNETVCHQHHRWTGGTMFPVIEQPSVKHLPELLEASRTHEQIVARSHKNWARTAFIQADEMVSHWNRIGQLPSCQRRLDDLFSRYSKEAVVQPHHLDPRAHAARYPETVAMTSLFVDADWMGLIRSHKDRNRTLGVDMVVQQVTGRYRPTGPADPLVQWVAKHHRHSGYTHEF